MYIDNTTNSSIIILVDKNQCNSIWHENWKVQKNEKLFVFALTSMLTAYNFTLTKKIRVFREVQLKRRKSQVTLEDVLIMQK